MKKTKKKTSNLRRPKSARLRGDAAKSPRGDRAESTEVPVVGIGYSAGGLEAARELLTHLSDDTGMAFVVIQHLQRGQESHLAEILAKQTRMPVKTIANGDRVRPNTVYVLSPDDDVILSGDYLNLNSRDDRGAHLPIDFFFSSLSQNRKTRAIGVVLSGAGNDGTLGLKAIKSEGGVTIVQDPKGAKFDSMPRSVIACGVADLILSPSDIARELERISKHPYTKAAVPEEIASSPSETPDPDDSAGASPLTKILNLLRFHTQVDFSRYKSSTLRRRVERQMMLRRVETIDKYAEYLKKNADEVKALYEDIFIHVTDFFRDPEAFEALKEHVFPAMVARCAPDRAIRVWVPGCATGEEPYSLAIALTEFMEDRGLKLPIQIFATDISEPAIQAARKGVYLEHQVRKLSPERLEKFFDKAGDAYKIKKGIRDACIFSRHDVTSNPPIPKVDLISCRNVLIYFSAELQKRVFPVFHYALNTGGFLLLGRAENPGMYSKLFTAIDGSNKIYAKAKGHAGIHTPFSVSALGGPEPAPKAAAVFAAPVDGVRSADQLILYRYSPASVVVNDNLDVIQFRGRTVPFLEPPPGLASYGLLKMANPDLVAALRLCIQSARKQGSAARKEGVSFAFEGKKRKVNVDVSPLNPGASPKDRQYLVIFEEPTAIRAPKTRAKSVATLKPGKKAREDQLETLSQYNTQLLQELETSREYQQSLIEEYETAQEELTSANEELRSTNEELQSTNEELHSANEELGTSKEELQAANEELQSTNEEVQRRNADLESALKQLERSEERFRRMVEAVRDYAIFMLDPEGHVVSWNLGAERMKGYKASEIIGSHFSRFYTPEDIARNHPANELRIAVRDGVYEEEGWRVKKDGTRYWANVVITALFGDGKLIGFSKVTRDLTERKRAEDALKRSRDELETKISERTEDLRKANESLERAVAARDEFLSLASHELKTPLTSLLMQTQFRERSLAKAPESFTPEKLKAMFRTDQRQIHRMARLIEDMLDVSRISAKRLELRSERTDLCALAKDVLERFSPQFAAVGSEVTFDSCAEAIGWFDRFRMEQVIVNLFTNAMKYGGGKPVQVSVSVRDHRAVLAVRDHGIGISPADQERIFQQFERATDSEVATGLGLGLFIANQIVTAHGGTIRVKSELNAGAEFFVELPLEDAAKPRPESASP